MSARQGWIGDPQPTVEWHDSHASREADRIAVKAREPFTGSCIACEQEHCHCWADEEADED